MKTKETTHILFSRFEKQVIFISGKTEKEANKKVYNFLLCYKDFEIIKTIYHSNSGHLWIGTIIGNYEYNMPSTITGHSKKEVEKTVAIIKELLKTDIKFLICKLY